MLGNILGGIAGSLISGFGASKQNDAAMEQAEMSQRLPPWLQPYMTGEGKPFTPTPVNYNWLDAMNSIGQSGMPGQPPPMSMANPMMSFDNVYTPYEGGPWGYGLGPGQLTTEAGIPGGPGAQFLPQPEGFVPGAPGAPGDSAGDEAELGLLEMALRLKDAYGAGGESMYDGRFEGDDRITLDQAMRSAGRIQRDMDEGVSQREMMMTTPGYSRIYSWLNRRG